MAVHRDDTPGRATEGQSQAWSEVVAAFGGEIQQAEAEVVERWNAMQRVNPAATRDEAILRLAWEYKPRTIEHVFPGDNWTFMLKAAQSEPTSCSSILRMRSRQRARRSPAR